MFSDESGLVWIRFEGPHGKGTTSLYETGVSVFEKVLGCLWSGGQPENRPPTSRQSANFLLVEDQYIRGCIGEVLFTAEREFSTGSYKFQYSFAASQDGVVHGLTLEARPKQYGVGGIRSYLAIETIDKTAEHFTLKVFATPQDRPATVDDPLARAQEIGMYAGHVLATTEN